MWTSYFAPCVPTQRRNYFFIYLVKNMIFRKNLESQLIFVLFLRENKIRKKTQSVTPYLEKTVCGKPKSSPRVFSIFKSDILCRNMLICYRKLDFFFMLWFNFFILRKYDEYNIWLFCLSKIQKKYNDFKNHKELEILS